ncbi:MAG: response regulator transcription factor [Chloroflexota bacterium]
MTSWFNQTPAPLPASGPRKVLIADDQDSIRELVQVTLDDPNYQILETGDGFQALELARQEQPHVALLDVMMPGLSGIEVCRTLKQDSATAGIVVILLTAKAEDADRQAGLDAGADGYVTKPFRPLHLLRLVADLLER